MFIVRHVYERFITNGKDVFWAFMVLKEFMAQLLDMLQYMTVLKLESTAEFLRRYMQYLVKHLSG